LIKLPTWQGSQLPEQNQTQLPHGQRELPFARQIHDQVIVQQQLSRLGPE